MCFGGGGKTITNVETPKLPGHDPQMNQIDQLAGQLMLAPDMMDTAVIQAQLAKKQQLAGATGGRAATFLTGPGGVGGPSSSITKDFILAKFRTDPTGKGVSSDLITNAENLSKTIFAKLTNIAGGRNARG